LGSHIIGGCSTGSSYNPGLCTSDTRCARVHNPQFCAAIQLTITPKSSLIHKLINPTLQLLVHCICHFLRQATITSQACAAEVITFSMSPSLMLMCFKKWDSYHRWQAGGIATELTKKVSHALQQASEPQCDEQAMWAPAAWGIWWQQRLAW